MAEPKIKFRQDDGSNYPEWETIPMSEIFTEISEKNHPELPVLSVQQGVGTILRDSSDRNILYDKKNLNGYKAMKKDDFIIHLRSFEGGLECSNYDGISSPAYRILRPNRILSGAYRDYFRSDDFIRNKLAVSVVGIRDGKNIDMDTFWQILIAVPCLEEQQKIADFLSDVDTLIKTSEQELLKLKELKKGCLQKMFPRGDADVPEVRFPGFTGAWERRKLFEIAEFNPKSELPNEFEYVDLESVVGTEMISHRTEKKNNAPSRAQRLAKTGDVFFQTVRPYQRNNHLFAKSDTNYVFSTGYAQMRPKIDAHFLMSFLQTDDFVNVVLENCTGTSYPAINSNDLSKLDIKLPISIDEQKKIGEAISNLDNLIALQKRECEKYKELKKGLLQQMFV